MLKTVLMLLFLFASNSAMAEVKSDEKWYFPDSVKALCSDTEQSIVATYRAIIENNRKLTDINDKGDKRQQSQLSEEYKNLMIETEGTWARLDCASILYSDKSR